MFSGSSYHARMRPASTKSNAIPEKSHWEKRNDVGRKFISWKQKIMRGTAKTRNLERIQNEELGILRSRSMQKAATGSWKTRDLILNLPPICVRRGAKKTGIHGAKTISTASPTHGRSTQAVRAAKCHATALRLCLLAISKMR